MTLLTLTLPRPAAAPALPVAAPGRSRSGRWLPRLALLVVLATQNTLARVTGGVGTPFEDEGLYIYMGHRMIDHLLHGAFLSEYPGAYFSGAPGFYPVLAAIGDSVGGLQGARTVSLMFALGATVSVNGLGRALYGRTAGLLGASAFVLCGSVIYQSDFATFDSTTLCLVAAAAWLTVHSVQRDRFLWAPVVAVLLVLAFYAKYAGAVFTPVVAVLAVAVAARQDRLVVARRTLFMLVCALTTGYAVYALWGQSLGQGIAVTTTSRQVLNPASAGTLLHQIVLWVGPWLALAVVGALLDLRRWQVPLVLLLGATIAPLQQVRLGESTSLAKHVAFGMVFAAPLIGLLLARLLERWRLITVPLALAAAVGLSASGLHYSHEFMTGWIDDTPLVARLAVLNAQVPGKPILGDQPAAERYALREQTQPLQWTDTYSFSYDGKTGPAAYQEAIDQTSFGIIYLGKQPYAGSPDGSATRNGAAVYGYLSTGRTPYRLVGEVDRVLRGKVVGQWFLYAPKAARLPGDPAPAPRA